jgi:tetratricopeptide (TPR) repeat protein
MLQLGNASERVVYLVGRALAQQGRVAMGASMMRDIAPARGGGFPPAHAWLAEYSMASWKGTQTQAEQLLADLGTAEKGGARLSAQQLAFYASLLDNKGRKQEAMQLLRNYTASYPELNLLILQLEKQEGVVGSDSRDALAAGRAEFERKQKSGSVTFEDIAQAVQLEMYAEEIDRALQLANAGFKQEPENLAARRLFSSMLIVKHQAVLEQWRIEVDRAQALRKAAPGIELRYLELACEIDSANPVITEELAKVMTMGQNLSPEMHKMLESSLIDGTASGVTHLILANHKLQSTEPHLALPELRLALRKMPDAAIVMNNLAYGILKFDPKNLPEAKLLIEKALSIPGSTTSQRASMLDTLAEIRMEMGDILGAIELYEEAIEHDSTKISSRQKLADAYLKAGMKDLSQAQLRKVQELNEASSNAAESN